MLTFALNQLFYSSSPISGPPSPAARTACRACRGRRSGHRFRTRCSTTRSSRLFPASLWLMKRVVESPLGKILQAIRENEVRAEAVGYNVPRFKLLAFVVGGAFSGSRGCSTRMLFGIVPLEAISFVFSGNVVFATLIGGSGSLYGPIIGSFVFIWLSESVSLVWARWPLLLGVAFVIVVLFFRGGVVEASRFWAWGHPPGRSSSIARPDQVLRRAHGAVNGVTLEPTRAARCTPSSGRTARARPRFNLLTGPCADVRPDSFRAEEDITGTPAAHRAPGPRALLPAHQHVPAFRSSTTSGSPLRHRPTPGRVAVPGSALPGGAPARPRGAAEVGLWTKRASAGARDLPRRAAPARAGHRACRGAARAAARRAGGGALARRDAQDGGAGARAQGPLHHRAHRAQDRHHHEHLRPHLGDALRQPHRRGAARRDPAQPEVRRAYLGGVAA